MNNFITIIILVVSIICIYTIKLDYSSPYYTLPLLPDNFEILFNEMYENTVRPTDKKIPRNFWLSFREIPAPDKIPEHLEKVLNSSRQLGWKIHMVDNAAKDRFMEKYFIGTSILHAYKNINIHAKVAASDIWRYCALYIFGGVYMDDDSFVAKPFEKIISPDHSMIMSFESNRYKDDCFIPAYHLSNYHNHKKYNTTIFHQYAGDRTLVTWLMMVEPRHPVMFQILKNIVDVHHHEYSRMRAMKLYRFDAKWKAVMCGTGPPLVTATIRQEMLKKDLNTSDHHQFSITFVKKDFEDYGGVFKVDFVQSYVEGEGSHYMVYMNKHNVQLLATYRNLTLSDIEGDAIMDPSQKHLYYVKNYTRHAFPSYDTYLAMGFHLQFCLLLTADEFKAIPVGETLPALDYTGPVM